MLRTSIDKCLLKAEEIEYIADPFSGALVAVAGIRITCIELGYPAVKIIFVKNAKTSPLVAVGIASGIATDRHIDNVQSGGVSRDIGSVVDNGNTTCGTTSGQIGANDDGVCWILNVKDIESTLAGCDVTSIA